jgi:plastocyanin domain-containing protein
MLIIRLAPLYLFAILSFGGALNCHANIQDEAVEAEVALPKVQELYVEIKDHKFIPEFIEARANTKIKLIVENKDDLAEEFESVDLHRERMLPPKQKITIIIAPLKIGKYHFFGEFHPDSANGYLIVK